jgi:mRNA-degrading endonuclease RelE of RelBE toxin-antitoxin system
MRKNPYAGDVKFLRGTDGALRRRFGDWRVLFELRKDKHLIVILAVKRRGSNTY